MKQTVKIAYKKNISRKNYRKEKREEHAIHIKVIKNMCLQAIAITHPFFVLFKPLVRLFLV